MARILVISGAGISAESGLKTFRDDGGLWRTHSFQELASPEAWARDRQLVLDFYNERRRLAREAKPNDAHLALARLESHHEVVIVTQNVDDLHERAGSTGVIHLHGELNKARSTLDSSLVYPVAGDINVGDQCERGSQLRPHIVWFGEQVMHYDRAQREVALADKVLVVGTSLAVYPAAGLLHYARDDAEKVLVTLAVENPPARFRWLCGPAATHVPQLVDTWLEQSA